MNESERFGNTEASGVAKELVAILEPCCEAILVCGSLRRRKEFCSDIEILFVPKIEKRIDHGDLFINEIPCDAAAFRLEMLLMELLEKRPNKNGAFTWGEQNKLAVHVPSGIPVDFFATTLRKWPNAMVVRTGPTESNIRIASAAKAMGWDWHANGDGFTRGEGKHPIDIKIVTSEREVFEFVNLEYKEPWLR